MGFASGTVSWPDYSHKRIDVFELPHGLSGQEETPLNDYHVRRLVKEFLGQISQTNNERGLYYAKNLQVALGNIHRPVAARGWRLHFNKK